MNIILSNSSLALILFFTFAIFWKTIVYPIFFSPLSRIPCAHWSSRFSSAWILWVRYSSRELKSIHEAHRKYGPVVRLGPRELSVNCVEGGIKTIYSGGFDKHEWYANLFVNYGVLNMFSTSYSKPHSVRKRMISNVYSKSFILSSPAMNQITRVLVKDRFLPLLKLRAGSEVDFDIFSIFTGVTIDFVTAFIFGLSSNADFLRKPEERNEFFKSYENRQTYNFWPQELPSLTRLLSRLGFRPVPSWVDCSNEKLEAWTLNKCDQAADFLENSGDKASTGAEDEKANAPTVYYQLQTALSKYQSMSTAERGLNYGKPNRLIIASELLDQYSAGFDTSTITLTYFVHEISKRPDWQRRLREELLGLEPNLKIVGDVTNTEVPSAKVLESLPILQATLQETLRLRAAIPGPQPRITPAAGCVLGPNGEYNVPGGIRVSAQAHSLHRNPEVFPEPEEWKPERWMIPTDSAKFKEMNRWFWAFGSGGRMCIGSNLAIYQMKYILAAIYSNWETEIVNDIGIEQKDIYTAPPKSGYLIIKLKSVE